MSINGHVFLGLGEVTRIEPLRQCLINCRSAFIQEAEMYTHVQVFGWNSHTAALFFFFCGKKENKAAGRQSRHK